MRPVFILFPIALLVAASKGIGLSVVPSGGDAVAVAGVNATILSILVAAALVYLAVVLRALHSMRDEIIDKATAITRLGQRVIAPGDADYGHPWQESYDGRVKAQRERLVSSLLSICHRDEAKLPPIKAGDPPVPPVPPVSLDRALTAAPRAGRGAGTSA